MDPICLRSRDYFISPLNTVTVEKRDVQTPFVVHYHEFDELVIVSAGNGLHIWNDIPYPITCGDVIYINAGDRHGYRSTHSLRLDNILYRRGDLALAAVVERYLPAANAGEAERFWRIPPSDIHRLTPLIDNLSVESQNPDPLSVHHAEALFMQLVLMLYRFRHRAGGSLPEPAQQLDILLTTLHNSVKSAFSLDDFCKRHGVASRSLHRLFKAQTGMTIVGYLQQLRLCKAMQLLRNTALSINQVAAECGYEDSNYFSSVFRKETSLTPSKYRARFTRGAQRVPIRARLP